MTTTVEALKALYTTLGGSLTDYYSDIAGGVPVSDYVLIPDCIQAITKKAGAIATAATTPELPAVTATENGKVLKVIEGKWAVGTDEIQA